MANVVITVHKSRFEQFGITPPADWDVILLDNPFTEEALIAAAKDAEYLLVESGDRVSKEVIDACPKLKMIQTEGVAFDKVDGAAAREKGVLLCNNKNHPFKKYADETIVLPDQSLIHSPYFLDTGISQMDFVQLFVDRCKTRIAR